MSDTRTINVGLMGFGVVGGGVAATLQAQSDAIRRKTGLPVKVKRILVRDRGKHRDASASLELLTTNPDDILDDNGIQVVVEAIGGSDPAGGYLKRALTSGKHVVTANKEVMAQSGPELVRLAEKHGVNLLFEASVGGGIPIVGCLMNELVANDVFSIRGIINGTTNYILTRMAQHHTDFHQALAEAQQLGYAEADPTSDIEGLDAAFKLAILSSLAYHHRVAPEDIYRQGIASLEPKDFQYAEELGYAIKSLAVATLEGDSIQARLYPALVPQDNMLANVDGVYNAVEVEGSLCGKILFYGMGAGREPTTSAIVGDVIEVGRRISSQGPPATRVEHWRRLGVESIDALESRYYIRLTAADRSGVLAQIARVFGDYDISLASVLQKDTNPADNTAELVITTHNAVEASVQKSLGQLGRLEVVTRVNNMLRIES